ncbi:hypothetical protein [Alteromonas sp. 14N.309.X.WAT.G.H12]|uniref:hypothetical protein n=1 Tax=Alteromonas sp. 14N.309.X.WAT.G.H12 TaxID=3120824 RepID=UPI002FD7067B
MREKQAQGKSVGIRYGNTQKRSHINKKNQPPLGAMIICDGSYLEDKMCGGIAGTLRLIEPGKPYRDIEFNATTFGARNSVVVELYAISRGVQLLSQYAKENGFHVKELHVFSDSKWGMGGYERMKRGESYYPAYTPGLKMLSNALKTLGDIMPRFTHVKAHVATSNASRIERWHNEIDLRASKQSHEALSQFNHPTQNNAYGALLPSVVDPEQAVDVSNMAYALAKEGMFARVVFDGSREEDATHPFIQGVSRAADELGKPLRALYFDATEYTPKVFGQNGARVRNGTMEDFAYRTIASGLATEELKEKQKALYNAGREPKDKRRIVQPFTIKTNNNDAAMVAESVQLLHGKHELKKYYSTNQTPFNSMSQFLLDMSGTVSLSKKGAMSSRTRADWLILVKNMHKHARVPVLKNVKSVFLSFPNAREHIMPGTASVLNETLLPILQEYMSVLTPQQITNEVVHTLNAHDLKADMELIRQVVNTNNATSPESAAQRIVDSCLPKEIRFALPVDESVRMSPAPNRPRKP